MSGVGRPAGQRDKAPRKSRGGADRARALARAASSAGPGASLASFLSHGGSAGSSGDAPAAAPAVAAPPDAEMEETTVVEEPAPGSGGLPSGPPGAPRPPDLQPDPVVPEARPGTDGGDQEEADAAGHDAGAADGPEQRADPEREDAEDAFIDDDDDDMSWIFRQQLATARRAVLSHWRQQRTKMCLSKERAQRDLLASRRVR